MKKEKKKSGCIGRIIKILFSIMVLIAIAAGAGNSNKDKNTSTAIPTTQPTAKATIQPTAKVTETPQAKQTEEPLTIILKYPELGEYGRYYTMNDKVKKAAESDKETIIQCFVPAGSYIVTYEGKAPWSYVNVYTEETVITEDGWEEYADTWISKQLKQGDSCEVTVPEGWYIHLNENDIFRLVEEPTKETSLDKYVAKFNLPKRCKDIIMIYLPDYENFSSMEQDALRNYSIFMKDGTKYYLAVSEDKEPLCLQSSEKDYESRTRYYDKYEE